MTKIIYAEDGDDGLIVRLFETRAAFLDYIKAWANELRDTPIEDGEQAFEWMLSDEAAALRDCDSFTWDEIEPDPLESAAPALLAALIRLRDCPDVQMDNTDPETDAARLQANAAIAKAEGGQ